MQAAPSAPIDASKFVAYVTERRKKRILFKGEFIVSFLKGHIAQAASAFVILLLIYMQISCKLISKSIYLTRPDLALSPLK